MVHLLLCHERVGILMTTWKSGSTGRYYKLPEDLTHETSLNSSLYVYAAKALPTIPWKGLFHLFESGPVDPFLTTQQSKIPRAGTLTLGWETLKCNWKIAAGSARSHLRNENPKGLRSWGCTHHWGFVTTPLSRQPLVWFGLIRLPIFLVCNAEFEFPLESLTHQQGTMQSSPWWMQSTSQCCSLFQEHLHIPAFITLWLTFFC